MVVVRCLLLLVVADFFLKAGWVGSSRTRCLQHERAAIRTGMQLSRGANRFFSTFVFDYIEIAVGKGGEEGLAKRKRNEFASGLAECEIHTRL